MIALKIIGFIVICLGGFWMIQGERENHDGAMISGFCVLSVGFLIFLCGFPDLLNFELF